MFCFLNHHYLPCEITWNLRYAIRPEIPITMYFSVLRSTVCVVLSGVNGMTGEESMNKQSASADLA
jgi:hypothetical protein